MIRYIALATEESALCGALRAPHNKGFRIMPSFSFPRQYIKISGVEFYIDLGAEKKKETDRTLYLAIPQDIYTDFFTRQFIQDVIDEYQVKLIVFHPMREEIVLWKE